MIGVNIILEFNTRIANYTNYYCNLWECIPSWVIFENFPYTTTPEERKNNEKTIFRTLKNYYIKTKTYSILNSKEELYKFKLKLLEEIIDTIEPHFKIMFEHNFIQNANSLATDIKNEQLFPTNIVNTYDQIVKSVFFMNFLQLFFKGYAEYNDIIMAYNLLYVYTDNYLDSPKLSSSEKKSFSLDFKKYILGQKFSPKKPLEERIFSIFDIIERHYPRNANKTLYEGLLALQDSQELGTMLSKSRNHIDIFKNTITRGGLAVLCEGFLIGNDLTEDDEKDLFGIGAILQLVDDLLDINEDAKNKTTTIYTWNDINPNINLTIVKLVNFIAEVIISNKLISKNPELQQTLLRTCLFFTFEGAAKNQSRLNRFISKEINNTHIYSISTMKYLTKVIHKELKYFIFKN